MSQDEIKSVRYFRYRDQNMAYQSHSPRWALEVSGRIWTTSKISGPNWHYAGWNTEHKLDESQNFEEFQPNDFVLSEQIRRSI